MDENTPRRLGTTTVSSLRQLSSRLWAVGILALLSVLVSGCKDTPLYSALSEQQANEVEAALLRSGISTEKRREGKDNVWSVHIPHARIADAMQILEEKGLPREPALSLKQVFPKEGFVSSPTEEKARYIYALSQELASTLMMIDGVVSARVHVALPQKQVLDDATPPASASVVIIQEAGYDLATHETDIKAIVTDGIEDMNDVNRVTVKFFTKGKSALPVRKPPEPMMASTGWLVGFLGILLGILGGAGGLSLRKRMQKAQPADRRP